MVAAALVADMPLKLPSSARRHTLKHQQHFGFVSPKRVFDRRRGDLALLLLAVPEADTRAGGFMSMNSVQARAITSGPCAHAAPHLSLLVGRLGHPPFCLKVFYRAAAGAEPVRQCLRSLSTEDRRTIGTDLATLQVGWPIGMPLCRSLGAGLWEVRSRRRHV